MLPILFPNKVVFYFDWSMYFLTLLYSHCIMRLFSLIFIIVILFGLTLTTVIKRIIRFCTNSAWLAHTPPLFAQLNTLKICDLHKLITAIFMYNYTNNNVPSNFVNYFVKNAAIHLYGTRTAHMFWPAFFSFDLAKNTIHSQGALLWNSIPDNIKNYPSFYVFKKKYKDYLINLYNWFLYLNLYSYVYI